MDRLMVYKEEESGRLVCGGRVQAFNEDELVFPFYLGLDIAGS